MLTNYVLENHLCDYMTSVPGGQNAVRECCELMMGITTMHDRAVNVRMEYGEEYQRYLALRKAVKTMVIKP
jgi:3-deoxy-D-manno-octulosonate 8-phosphate phosphatase (KDO 8-P phosphatase)